MWHTYQKSTVTSVFCKEITLSGVDASLVGTHRAHVLGMEIGTAQKLA